jgi:hypothetical protein
VTTQQAPPNKDQEQQHKNNGDQEREQGIRAMQQPEVIGHCDAFQIAGKTGNQDVTVMHSRQCAEDAIDGRQPRAAIGRQCVERSEKLAVAWIC